MQLKQYIPELTDEHRKLFKEVHEICKREVREDFNIDISPAYRLVILTPKDVTKHRDGMSFNHMEYCFLVLPEILPLQTWKYGLGHILHLRAKMDECIRNGEHPIEYLHKKFTNK